MKEDLWYEDGLAFECTMCGNCCTGPPGFVHFTTDEGRAMAKTLGLSHQRFLDEYTHILRGKRSLREVETEHGADCVFLDRDTVPGKAVCRVYDARPMQCRTWPFWPENVRHPRDWQRTGRLCPGVDHGPIIPVEEIIRRLNTPVDGE